MWRNRPTFDCASQKMKLNFKGERVLAVVAHPDDAELFCAGTLARARQDDATIAVCVMCQGDKGQPSKTVRNLASVRRKEAQAACKLLGAEFFHGGVPDGMLSDDAATRRTLLEIYRQFKPSLVLAHSPDDYHADHRAAAALAEAVSWFCASRGYRSKSSALPSAPALWWMDTLNMLGFTPDFFVDITPFAVLKERMMTCHKSQLLRAKDADFSPLTDLMRWQMQTRGRQAGVAAAEAFRVHNSYKRARAW